MRLWHQFHQQINIYIISFYNPNPPFTHETTIQLCFSDWLTDQLHCTEDYNSDIDNIDCYSYEVDDLKHISNVNDIIQMSVLHINIHSIPDKFDKLPTLISRLYQMNIEIHFFQNL